MRFLKHHYSRTKMDYDSLHEMEIEELVNLRNTITAFRDMWKIYDENLREVLKLDIIEINPDFNTLRMNKHMLPEVLDKINGMIGKRNMASIRKRREMKENKEK